MKNNELRDEVIRTEREVAESDTGRNAAKQESLKLPVIFAGALIYAFGMNVFLKPLRLYAGGFMGFAQIITTLLNRAGMSFGGIDLSGILYYVLNVPAMIIAWKQMRHRFIVKTLFAVSMITVLLTVIPIPAAPVLDDTIANVLISGLICGAGIGVILRMGACDGGMTLVGMLILSDSGKSSIGRIGIGANIVLYAVMLFLFDVPTVIYSLIYSTVSSLSCDRFHTQNISAQVLILTKLEDTREMEIEVMGRLHRGMTELSGEGAFTGDREKIFLIFVSKFETARVRSIVRQYDPNAFIVISEGVTIDGNFQKKLT